MSSYPVTPYGLVNADLKTNVGGGIGDPCGTRPIVICARALDPLGTLPGFIIPMGTPLGYISDTNNADFGKWMPVRRVLQNAAETQSGWNLVLNVATTVCFQVGDVVQLVDVATNAVTGNLGAITAIDATANTITVTDGLPGNLTENECWVEVTESAGDTFDKFVLLRQSYSLIVEDGSVQDREAEGVFNYHDRPVYTSFINAAGGVDARMKAAVGDSFLFIDE